MTRKGWYAVKQKNQSTNQPVMRENWEMQSTFALLPLSGPFWPGMVASERILSLGQIELFEI